MAKEKNADTASTSQGSPKVRPASRTRPVKPYSPASERLYSRGQTSAQKPQPAKAPAAAPNSPPPVPGEAQPASNKRTIFWIVTCAVVGLGLYLIAIVTMSDQRQPAEIVQGRTGQQNSEENGLTASHVSARDVERAALSATGTTESEENASWTVRIIQLPTAKQAQLKGILQAPQLRALIGNEPAFIVHLQNGGIVGCVGKFVSPDSAKAQAVRERFATYAHNGRKPFESAMIWKFK